MRCTYSELLLVKHGGHSGGVANLIKELSGSTPKAAVAHNNLGNALIDLKRHVEALAKATTRRSR